MLQTLHRQQLNHLLIGTTYQGCSLGLDVSVSRRSRDVVSRRLGLVSVSWKRGKVSVSISSRTENQTSRSRTIGSRLQANVHSFLLHCKISPTSFSMQGVYIVHWFTSLLIYCSATAYQYATWYGCMPRARRHCVRWEPSHHLPPSYKGHSSLPPIFGPCLFWKTDRHLSYRWVLVI